MTIYDHYKALDKKVDQLLGLSDEEPPQPPQKIMETMLAEAKTCIQKTIESWQDAGMHLSHQGHDPSSSMLPLHILTFYPLPLFLILPTPCRRPFLVTPLRRTPFLMMPLMA